MPTKAELEKKIKVLEVTIEDQGRTIAKLESENADLFSLSGRMHDRCTASSELIESYAEQMAIAQNQSSSKMTAQRDAYERLYNIAGSEAKTATKEAENLHQLADAHLNKGLVKSENANEKYKSMLPNYIKHLKNGKSKAQSAQLALKAFQQKPQQGNQKTKDMSERHLIRALDKLRQT